MSESHMWINFRILYDHLFFQLLCGIVLDVCHYKTVRGHRNTMSHQNKIKIKIK